MRVAFNQDSSCVVAGTAHGFRVYNCSPFGKFFGSDPNAGSAGLAEMLFSTSLVAVAGTPEAANESPRRLRVVNTRKPGSSGVLCELSYPTSVLQIRLNRQRLVVVLEDQIYIYNIVNMRLLHTLETVMNKYGISAVTPNPAQGANFLVYPSGAPAKHHVAPRTSSSEAVRAPQGDLVVFDLESLSPLNVIRAHRSPLAAVALNEDGTLLATSSTKGTLVRVFAVPSGNLLYEFRRGSYQSQVYSLAFSLGSNLLCVSSATQTVHIYRLEDQFKVPQPAPEEDAANADVDDDYAGDYTTDSALDAATSATGDLSIMSTASATSGKGDRAASGAAVDSPEPESATDAVASAGATSAGDGGTPAKPKKKRWFSRKAWEPSPRSRDFAWFKLPLKQGTRTVIGLAPLSNVVYVATESGKLFHYSVNMERGGECEKIGEYTLD